MMKAADRRVFLFTHAEEPWTLWKLEQTGLIGKFDKVECFSVNEVKSVQQKAALENLGIDPRRLLVIGDNVRGDIQPLYELGGEHAILVGKERPYCPENDQLTIDLNSIARIESIKDLPQAILEQLK